MKYASSIQEPRKIMDMLASHEQSSYLEASFGSDHVISNNK